MKLKHLDLFSGIGGFALGLGRTGGFETVAFCEYEEFLQKLLRKNFPGIKIIPDIKNANKRDFDEIGKIDICTGGHPCQPYSTAGNRKGRSDDRDLWPEMFRVIKETMPTWIIVENVIGFMSMEFTRTKTDLESLGYKLQPFIIPACAIDAEHRRERVWIVAHLDGKRLGEKSASEKKEDLKRFGKNNRGPARPTYFDSWWADKTRMGRAVYGLPDRMDGIREQRIAALGNSVLPGIVEIIGHAILNADREDKAI